MADYDEISDAEKLRLAQQYLLASPPGEIKEVAKDVTKLLPAGLLTDSVLRGALHAYNAENALTVDIGDGQKLVVCKEGEIDNAHYIETRNRKVYGFDHVKQEVVVNDVQDASTQFTSALESYRLDIQNALENYNATQFGNQGGVAVFSNDSIVTIVFAAERVNLRNFWSGRWKSKWTLSDISSSGASLSGVIDLHVHYFEDGNLQLQSRKDVARNLSYQGSIGHAVVDAIREEESAIHRSLEDMYINMSEETFKEMRRVMPVTQTKMEWSIHAHRTAKDLGRK